MVAPRVALCVGVSQYGDVPLCSARCARDATALASALRDSAAFDDVTLLLDPDVAALQDGVDAFVSALRPGGLGVFFYAGHGAQAADGRNYLLPAGGALAKEKHLRRGALAVADVLDAAASAAPGATLVLLLDACREAPWPLERSKRAAAGDAHSGFSGMSAPEGGALACACAPGETAVDGAAPGDADSGGDAEAEAEAHGAFATHLLRHLSPDEPQLPLGALLAAVAAGVRDDTGGRQTPHVSVAATAAELTLLLPRAPSLPPLSPRASVAASDAASKLAAWLTRACELLVPQRCLCLRRRASRAWPT